MSKLIIVLGILLFNVSHASTDLVSDRSDCIEMLDLLNRAYQDQGREEISIKIGKRLLDESELQIRKEKYSETENTLLQFKEKLISDCIN